MKGKVAPFYYIQNFIYANSPKKRLKVTPVQRLT